MNGIYILRPNDIYYTENESLPSRFTHERISDDIDELVERKLVGKNDLNDVFTDLIDSYVQPPEHALVYTTNIYSDTDKLYQMCHLALYDDGNNSDVNNGIRKKKCNKYASMLCDKLFDVHGTTIIFKFNINKDNGDVVFGNMTEYDLYELVRSKNIFKGVVLSWDEFEPNIEFEYSGSPLCTPYIDTSRDHQFHEIEFFDKILMVYKQCKPKGQNVNARANRLTNNIDSFVDDVIIVMKAKQQDMRYDHDIYHSITSDMVNKALELINRGHDIGNNDIPMYKHSENKFYNTYIVLDKLYEKIPNHII